MHCIKISVFHYILYAYIKISELLFLIENFATLLVKKKISKDDIICLLYSNTNNFNIYYENLTFKSSLFL